MQLCIIGGVQASEGVMIALVPRWRAGVALVAMYTLVLQSLLYSLAPFAHSKPNPQNGLFAICPLSVHSSTQDEAPGIPTDYPDLACCVLCLVSALDAADAAARGAALHYQSSRSSPLAAWVKPDLRGATELQPINPRAPPYFV